MTEQKSQGRLHIHNISECNMGCDAEVGELFMDMRRNLGLPIPELAKKLNTRPEVIAALEGGDLALLPPWAETNRIITAYAGMLRLDPGPIMRRVALIVKPPQPVVHPHPAQPQMQPQHKPPPQADRFPQQPSLQADKRYDNAEQKPVKKSGRMLGKLLWLAFLAGAAYLAWMGYQDPDIRVLVDDFMAFASAAFKGLVASVLN